MGLKRVTAPAGPVLTLAAARRHLNLVATGSPPAHIDDDFLLELIDAAAATVDGADGWLGRALAPQTWQLTLDAFPDSAAAIQIPLPPLISVSSVKYFDSDGVERTLSSSLYTVDAASEPGWIVPSVDEDWPATYDHVNAVTIEFVAGYQTSSSPATDPGENVPAAIKQGLRLLIGHWYRNREDSVIAASATGLPSEAARNLLMRYRVWPP